MVNAIIKKYVTHATDDDYGVVSITALQTNLKKVCKLGACTLYEDKDDEGNLVVSDETGERYLSLGKGRGAIATLYKLEEKRCRVDEEGMYHLMGLQLLNFKTGGNIASQLRKFLIEEECRVLLAHGAVIKRVQTRDSKVGDHSYTESTTYFHLRAISPEGEVLRDFGEISTGMLPGKTQEARLVEEFFESL